MLYKLWSQLDCEQVRSVKIWASHEWWLYRGVVFDIASAVVTFVSCCKAKKKYLFLGIVFFKIGELSGLFLHLIFFLCRLCVRQPATFVWLSATVILLTAWDCCNSHAITYYRFIRPQSCRGWWLNYLQADKLPMTNWPSTMPFFQDTCWENMRYVVR